MVGDVLRHLIAYLRAAMPSVMFQQITNGEAAVGMPPFGPASSNPIDEPGGAVLDGHDRGPERVVVVARHGTAVRARARDRHQVAGRDVPGHELVLDQDVPRLAVLADHTAEDRSRLAVS